MITPYSRLTCLPKGLVVLIDVQQYVAAKKAADDQRKHYEEEAKKVTAQAIAKMQKELESVDKEHKNTIDLMKQQTNTNTTTNSADTISPPTSASTLTPAPLQVVLNQP